MKDGDITARLPATIGTANYSFLFVALCVILMVGPALDQFMPAIASYTINALCFSGAMLLGIWSLANTRLIFRLGVVLAAAAVISSIVQLSFDMPAMRLVTLNLMLAFLVLSVWQAGRDVLFGGAIDANRIVGGLCIYMMLGLIWATMFQGLWSLSPHAFSGTGLGAAPQFWDFVYYSFVTLTTLGYGDVSPVSPFAKALALMEALIGQLYVAVLIAALIGTYLSKREDG